MQDQLLNSLVEDFSKLPEVEGILLAGSRGSGHEDQNSDYDVYIYMNKSIDLAVRKDICDRYCQYMEYNNTYWELEDDGILNNGIVIELIYRDLSIFNSIDGVCFDFKASIGYSTCFWYNIVHSLVLYDRNGILTEKIKQYQIPFPDGLRKNIIKINEPLLKGKIPSYYEQIEKAIVRKDYNSVNHRLTAFLASYFDILFAFNSCLHPGEKKLLSYVLKLCHKIPVGFEEHMTRLFTGNIEDILPTLDSMIFEIRNMLRNDHLI